MATFSILVTSAPFDSQGSNSALQFIRAAIESGHSISGVFFYQSAVTNVSAWQSPPADELQLHQEWLALHQAGVPLHVCATAAARRGILGADEAQARNLSGTNLQEQVLASGLGQLMVLLNSDRLVQF
ncbi:sulfurtransferase complex subunit TusD [Bowmanella denitrificans]|uniref:Sulfurtransferase complex subunit TusD n=1 Tax=Bowmanella denitrificans TaxID=366582 RepID=A0ABN0WRS9_9ALTE